MDMSQLQNEVEPETAGQSVAALKKAVEELESIGKEREEAQKVQQELKKFRAFRRNRTRKKDWKREVKRLRKAEKSFAEKVVDLLKVAELPVDTDTKKRAIAALNDVPPPKFDWVKVVVISIVFGVIFGITVETEGFGKPLVFAGLLVAAVGQICESAGNSTEAQLNPRFKDGLKLFGEVVKIFGVLAALGGFAFDSVSAGGDAAQ